ncbi:tetratricopeptide repeat protein [Tamlana sp. 2_MG-2023]|uniref:tetratricopeptide repeat protein n=1 Tax=unclassified Tamlana TaxID=2614803 RepID=UPI0026E39CDF|nr:MULTISPECIES: tetratricopeptide repeat protein [unclassified Tamlana]MDO6760580.1 tetratricopeptide repeat protein [Tamlana sp. 2_MG-2023]MDO6790836.1 tetratricopeptide repeat protein [Tamlana sp. 1_MG-2023]
MNFIKYLLIITLFCVNYSLNAQEKTSVSHELRIKALKKRLNSAQKDADSLKMAQVYIKLADFYKSLNLDSEALKNYHLAQEFHIEKDTFFIYANNNIAAIQHKLKHFKEAKFYLYQSLKISKGLPFPKGLATANTLLGGVAEKEGDYDKALAYQEQSLVIFKMLGDSTGLAITHENIGSIYEDLEQFDVANSYFKKAYSYEVNPQSDLKINIINNLGDVNRKQGRFDASIRYTQHALELARKTKNIEQEESGLKDLARTYADMGKHKEAYRYLFEQNILNDEAFKRRNADLVSAMEVLYHVKESEGQLVLLKKQNQINETRQFAILISSVAMFLMFVVWFIYMKKRKRQEQEILEYKQQILQKDLESKIAQEAALKKEIDIKISALTNYSLNIAHKNKMLSDISKTLTNLKSRNGEFVKSKLEGLAKEIDFDLVNGNEWTELMGFFGKIHPDYFKNLKEAVNMELSASELRLCMLLRLNLSSKEIASILHITPDSVRIARYRLRKKLPIDSKTDLQGYLLNL